MTYAQLHDFGSIYGLLSKPKVLQMSGSAGATNAQPSLTDATPVQEALMAHKALNARNDSTQYQDPIITNARLVNLAAEIERNLAARRALRPIRSEAARKGWGTRRDR